MFRFLTHVLIITLTLGGFFLTLNGINDLRSDVRELGAAVELLSKNYNPAKATNNENTGGGSGNGAAPLPIATTSTGGTSGAVVIPAAIVFITDSSPALQPQTKITVIIESVSKDASGKVSVAVKALTNEADSYSALAVNDLFELVDLSATNQKPTGISGKFDSLPPKSAVNGVVSFNIKPDQDTIILQVNTNGDMVHYEFDFKRGSYKKTVLG